MKPKPSKLKRGAHVRYSAAVRRLKAEIRELKSELRSETKWANEYFKTCEQLNAQLNKYREKDQSLLRTMVVQTSAPANHDNYLNYASRRFFKCKRCARLHSREAV